MGIKFDISIGMACWKIIHYIKNLNHICAMVVGRLGVWTRLVVCDLHTLQ